jgi:hypothetical protein
MLHSEAEHPGRRVTLPDLQLPEADITEEASAPLFSTDEDFATASRRLIAYKALEIP